MDIVTAKLSNRTRTGIRLSALFAFMCALAMAAPSESAKPAPDGISIVSAAADSIAAPDGQGTLFSAHYVSDFEDAYKLYVCKSESANPDGPGCQDGAWCESDDFTNATNQLSCIRIPSPEDSVNDPAYMFVCGRNSGCSARFTVSPAGAKNFLDIRAPLQANFQAVPFSFRAQKSSGNKLGDVTVSSSGKNTSWNVNLSAYDWKNEKGRTMDYDSDGNGGQLTVDLSEAFIGSASPSEKLIIGKTASFSSSVKNISILRTNKKTGSGEFTIKNIKLDQSVPGNQEEGNYKTVLIFTIS